MRATTRKVRDLGERRGDLLGHAVGEEFLARVAGQIHEGQHRNRDAAGTGAPGATLACCAVLAPEGASC